MEKIKNDTKAQGSIKKSYTTIFAQEISQLIDLSTQKLFITSEIAKLEISFELIRTYVLTVSENYYRNSYHSFYHGVDVMFTFDKFISLSLLDITPKEHFFLLIIALNHDVLHPGCSNRCLITRNPMLPIIINNISVNEMVSVDMCKNIINKVGLFVNIKEDDRKLFEYILNALLLATDIESPRFGDIIESTIENTNSKQAPNKEARVEKRNILLGVLLRISDVGNCLFGFDECVNWGYRLYLEISGKKLRKYELEDNLIDAFKNQSVFLKGYITNLIVNAYKIGALNKSIFDDLARNLVKLIESFEKDFKQENIKLKELVNKYKKIIYWNA